ncbi:uncharacterized protein [Lepisosteus oculatus]|uniref:uncharacterized protein isoform X1 n=1 Tax=Lepisosteus oculatus TaxID=7918 RepID=UPI0035F5113B
MMKTVVLLVCFIGTNIAFPLYQANIGLSASNSLEILRMNGLGYTTGLDYTGLGQSLALPYVQSLVPQLPQGGGQVLEQVPLPAQSPVGPQVVFQRQGLVSPQFLLPAQAPLHPAVLLPAQSQVFFPPRNVFPVGALPPPVILSSRTGQGQMPQGQSPLDPLVPEQPQQIQPQVVSINPTSMYPRQTQQFQGYPLYNYYQFLRQQSSSSLPTQVPEGTPSEPAILPPTPGPLQRTPLNHEEDIKETQTQAVQESTTVSFPEAYHMPTTPSDQDVNAVTDEPNVASLMEP